MAVGDIYRVSIEAISQTAQQVNVVHYQTAVSVGPVGEEPEALATGLLAEMIPPYRAMTVDSMLFENIKVRGVTNPQLGFDLAVGLSGQLTGDNLPQQITALMLIRTGKIGRSFNGRMNLFVTNEAQSDHGAWIPGYATLVGDLFDAMQSVDGVVGLNAYTFNLGVYSETLLQFNAATNQQLVSRARTQRRRTIGFGN